MKKKSLSGSSATILAAFIGPILSAVIAYLVSHSSANEEFNRRFAEAYVDTRTVSSNGSLQFSGNNIDRVEKEPRTGKYIVYFKKAFGNRDYVAIASNTHGFATITENRPGSVGVILFNNEGIEVSEGQFSILVYGR